MAMGSVKASLFLLCLSIVAADALLHNASKTPAYARLRNELLKRDAVVHKIPPEIDRTQDEPFTLTFELLLVDILDIDDIQQWSWSHDDLKWDPAGYEGIEKILIATDSLWVPDVTILVGQRDSMKLSCPQNLILDSTGLLLCTAQTYITFRCQINFEMYPFDTQECHFGLLYTTLLIDFPVRHNLTDVNSDPDDAILITQYITAGEWLLMKSRAEMYQDLNNVSYPRYVFTVQRRSTFYVITILFPMVLTSIMVTLVFLIPASTGEKISYLVSIFTSSAIFLSFISDVMPRNLASLPFLAGLLVEVMCQGLGATLATLWVVNKYEAEHKMGHLFHSQHPTKISLLMMVQKCNENAESKPKHWITKVTPYETKPQDQPKGLDDLNISEDTSRARPAKCYLTSSHLDRIFFIFFVVFQIIYLGALFGVTGWTHS